MLHKHVSAYISQCDDDLQYEPSARLNCLLHRHQLNHKELPTQLNLGAFKMPLYNYLDMNYSVEANVQHLN